MDITDDGKVGIGTVVPTELLSVVGTGTSITGTTVTTFSTQQDFNPRRGVMLGYDSSGQIGIISATTSAAAADLAFWSYNSGWSEKMRLKADGELTVKEGSAMASVTQGIAKMWANIQGIDTFTLKNSYNVSGATDAGTGTYEITLSAALDTTNDNVFVTGGQDGVVADQRFVVGITGHNMSTSVFRLVASREDGTTGVSTQADGVDIMVAGFGTHS